MKKAYCRSNLFYTICMMHCYIIYNMGTFDCLTDIGVILSSFPVLVPLNRFKLRPYKLFYFFIPSILDLNNIILLFTTTNRLSLSSDQLPHAISRDHNINMIQMNTHLNLPFHKIFLGNSFVINSNHYFTSVSLIHILVETSVTGLAMQ